MVNRRCHNLFGSRRGGFTMVEVVAATLILSILLSSVMFLMDRYLDAVVDMQLQQRAFEVARANMETLLASDKLSDTSDFGESELYPDITWSTMVEPFTEAYQNRMWIRAVCTAGYTDTKGEPQTVELEHWITSLTPDQIRKILNQQQALGEFYDLIKEGFMTELQMATVAFLNEKELPIMDEYEALVEANRREKVQWLSDHSDQFNRRAFDAFGEELDDEETEFLVDNGVDLDEFNAFAATYEPPVKATSNVFGEYGTKGMGDAGFGDPQNYDGSGLDASSNGQPDNPTTGENDTQGNQSSEPQWNWAKIPKELWPLIQQLTGATPPSN